ncbi:Lrp/AsnC family transcriptional regulator, partial [Pseudomonas aeruginosa]
MKLDAYDHRILAALQRDGRLSNVQLAEEIGLSPSPCLRRVRLLEEAGLIRGYQASSARDEAGLGLTVFVGITGERHRKEQTETFHRRVCDLPEGV